MSVRIGIPRETEPGEGRIAMVPSVAALLAKDGLTVVVERGAGDGCLIPDTAFAGAEFAADTAALHAGSDVILRVQPPRPEDIARLQPGAVVVGMLAPWRYPERIRALAAQGITSFALELLPRITRAQAMDVLSSQASVAGYKAVLRAGTLTGRFFPMLTTAAGTIRPATVIVLGAGVAGLQAIATARRLGAIVEAYDVRAAAKEQVASLGAKFLDLGVEASGEGGYARALTAEEAARQQEALGRHLARAEVVITTAAVPGRPAPRLMTRAMVEGMKNGAVIVDLAAETGGNCELTRPGETVKHGQVLIDGPINIAASLPLDASEMLARNLRNFLALLVREGRLDPDFDDEIVKGSLLTRDGRIVHDAVRAFVEGG